MRQVSWLLVATLAAAVGHVGTAHAQAEHFEPFRFDGGLTGSYVSASHRGGFGGVAEAKYLVHDQIAIGARAEAEMMFGGNIDAGGSVAMSVGVVGALLAKAEYYVTTGTARPFVGLSFGAFDIVSQSVGAGMGGAAVDQKVGRYFGVGPQIGFDLGRLRLAVTYNAMLGADILVHQSVGGTMQTSSYSQNYFAFEMSIRFGGERLYTPPPMPAEPPPPMPMYPPPAPPAPPPVATPVAAPAPGA
jgi:hypothetical protein